MAVTPVPRRIGRRATCPTEHVAVGIVRDRTPGGVSISSPIPATATAAISAARASATARSGSRSCHRAYEPRWFMRDQHMNPAERCRH